MILEQAVKLFNAKGYNGAAAAEIARASGISESILYKHFENKRALFLHCFHSIWDSLFSKYRDVYKANPDDELKYLEGVSRIYHDFVVNNPDKCMFIIHLLSYKNDPDFAKDYEDLMERSITTVEKVIISARKKGLIKNNAPSRFLAAAFVSQYFQVIVLRDFINPEIFTAESLFSQIKRALGFETERGDGDRLAIS